MPDMNIISEISLSHSKLRKLEQDLVVLRSQARTQKKRISLARDQLDSLISELASGQLQLPLFPPVDQTGGNGQVGETDPTAKASPADAAPVRARRKNGAPTP